MLRVVLPAGTSPAGPRTLSRKAPAMIATIPHSNRIKEEPEINDLLNTPWFRTAVESIAQSLRTLAVTNQLLTSQLALGKRRVADEAMALGLLIEMGPDIRRIAERLGVHRSTLYRWPKFMAMVDQVRTGGQGVRKAGAGKGGDE